MVQAHTIKVWPVDDKGKPYRPHTGAQREFHRHSLDKTAKVVFLCTGIRHGKTMAGAAQAGFDIVGQVDGPPLYWIVGPDYKRVDKARRTFMSMWRPLVKRYNRKREEISLIMPSGMRTRFSDEDYIIQVKSADDPDALRSEEVSGIWADENALIGEEGFHNMMGRVLHTGGPIRLTSTPRPEDEQRRRIQAWPKNLLIDEWEKEPGGPYRCVFGKTEDNPYFHTDKGRLELDILRRKMGPIRAAMELDGRYISISNLMLPEFDKSRHIVPQFQVSPNMELFAGIDFGFAAPSVVAYYALIGEQIVGFDEIVLINKNPMELARAILNHPMHSYVQAYYADISGGAWRQMLGELGVDTFPGTKDVELTYDFLRGLIGSKTSSGEPKLVWMDHLHNGIRELTHLHLPPSGNIKKIKNNHFVDASRYALHTHLCGRPTTVSHGNDKYSRWAGVPRWRLPPSVEFELYGSVSPGLIYTSGHEPEETRGDGYLETFGTYPDRMWTEGSE